MAEAVLMRKRLYKFLIGFVVSVAVSIMLLIALIWSVGNKVRGLCGGISIMLLIALNGPWGTR